MQNLETDILIVGTGLGIISSEISQRAKSKPTNYFFTLAKLPLTSAIRITLKAELP